MPWTLRMLVVVFFLLLLPFVYKSFRLRRSILELASSSHRTIANAVFFLQAYLILLPLWVIVSYLLGSGSPTFLFSDRLTVIDYLLVFPFWWSLIVTIEILPYLLILDGLRVVVRLTGKRFPRRWKKWEAGFVLSLWLVLIGYVGMHMYRDSSHIRFQSYQISIPDLPAELEGFSITALSDIQVDRYTHMPELKRAFSELNRRGSNLILFAGDLVTYGPRFIPDGLGLLCGLSAEAGKIACMGDHDFWSGPAEIAGGLRACEWSFLENAHQLISVANKKILITGVTHIYSQHISRADLRALLQRAPAADVKILLVHQPAKEILQEASRFGYHLLVAGHTHGGQLVFSWLGFNLTPSRFENPVFSGQARFGNLNVVVTNGIGFTFAPIRYRAPAEINTLILTGKAIKR